jgi:hypothetical protein
MRSTHEEIVVAGSIGGAQVTTYEDEKSILLKLHLLAVTSEHLPTREDRKRREDVEHPGPGVDDRRAGGGEDRAESDGADDAPEQYAVVYWRGAAN